MEDAQEESEVPGAAQAGGPKVTGDTQTATQEDRVESGPGDNPWTLLRP